MNNEPVAWMSNEYSVCSKKAYQTLSENARSWYPIPLYTHPVKEPTEYIKYRLAVKEFGESFCITYRTELLAYANSILRKAQEK